MMRGLMLSLAGRPGPYRALSVWSPPMAAVATLAILLLGSAVGMAVYGVATLIPDGRITNPQAMPTMSLPLVMLAMQAAWVGFTWLAASAYGGRAAPTLALIRPAQGWRVVPLGLLGLMGVLALFEGIVILVGPGDAMGDMKPFLGMFRSDQWWVATLMAGIGAPLSEELLFRGFLFSSLARSRYLGVPAAAVLTTAAWTAIHGYSGIGTLEVAMMGLYLSWLLWRTGSLWVTILCHAIYNTSLALMMTFGELPAVPVGT